MNSHSHAAWTAFAVEHGGIGTAMAVTDHELREGGDLAFSMGQHITVLCKLRDPGSPNCPTGLYLVRAS